MKIQKDYYGGTLYGFGNWVFWFWIHDERKSTLECMPKKIMLGSVGLFGWCITATWNNFFSRKKNQTK